MIIGLSRAGRLRSARHALSAFGCLLAAVALSLLLPAPETGAQTADAASSPGLSVALKKGGDNGKDGKASSGEVTEIPVSFEVVNRNTSEVPGPSDGKTYKIRGHITGPSSLLGDGDKKLDVVTLYLHGLAYGEFFYNFDANQKYNFAGQMAKRGHVSVTVDRLGYEKSGKPDGMKDSYGAQADIANQIVDDLREGKYKTGKAKGGKRDNGGGDNSPSFDKVILAGHSASGFIVQIAAYSFENIDGLMVFSLTDFPGNFSPLATQTFAETTTVCGGGGDSPDGKGGEPSGYAYFGQTDEDFKAAHIFNAKKSITKAVTKRRTRDPCGETASVPQASSVDTTMVPSIQVPVLLVYGENDALFPGAGPAQEALYTGSSDVTLERMADTGHALTFGRTAGQFRRLVSDWLKDRDFRQGKGKGNGKGNAGSEADENPSEDSNDDEGFDDDDEESGDGADEESGDDIGDILDDVEVPGL